MILYEYEGKELLKTWGINVPDGEVFTTPDATVSTFPVMLKAQVLAGHRADDGGIVRVNDQALLSKELTEMLSRTVCDEAVTKVLVEPFVPHTTEYYLAISYDTTLRTPVLIFSAAGGTGIEKRERTILPLDVLDTTSLPETPFPKDLIKTLVDQFFAHDCLLLEINPLVVQKTTAGEIWTALDAKITFDDTAGFRHKELTIAPRIPGHTPTAREVTARAIDENDFRGTAGGSYIDLDGDIAVLASGGGASLVALDALYKAGGRAANYVDYSGNPPHEKVVALTKVVLGKSNLKGLWIVGAVANFTDIYETLRGVIDGIKEAEVALGTTFTFPIVIRRGGPRDEEAFAMLRELHDPRLHLMGSDFSIAQSAEKIVSLAYNI